MYTKQEASAVRQKFWTAFGKYMQPVPSITGQKINWINYKTGVKGISFKMNADKNVAFVAIEIALQNEKSQQIFYEVFNNFKKYFNVIVGGNWIWEAKSLLENGTICSRIYLELKPINIFKESDWPLLITFFKTNIIAIDIFWSEYKSAFDTDSIL
ncbi:MAG: DUF4268 domain-containing protein [Ferruginibacter sp.]|nr:DUF4268 domain-containing protein [Ferruginibacter sp.]